MDAASNDTAADSGHDRVQLEENAELPVDWAVYMFPCGECGKVIAVVEHAPAARVVAGAMAVVVNAMIDDYQW